MNGRAGVMNAANGKIVYRFHARDVNLIGGSPRGAQSVRFAVKLDGNRLVQLTELTSTNTGK